MSLGYASKGVAGAGLGLGIAGTTLGVINSGGLLGGLFGGTRNANVVGSGTCCTPFVTQNEFANIMCYQNQVSAKDAEIAKAQSEVAMLKEAEKTDAKIVNTYKELIDIIRTQDKELQAQIRANETRLDKIDVDMQRISDGVERVFSTLDKKIDCCCEKMAMAINQEAERRCCNDNAIVSYVNATFQPNVVNRVTVTGGTVGVETQAETIFNPIGKCGCNCGTTQAATA